MSLTLLIPKEIMELHYSFVSLEARISALEEVYSIRSIWARMSDCVYREDLYSLILIMEQDLVFATKERLVLIEKMKSILGRYSNGQM